jgi:hypothetical protein
MPFTPMLPVTAWLWRQLSSCPACLLYFGILVMVTVSGIALRIQAAVFERRVLTAMSGLSSLKIDTTSKAEALSQMAGFNIDERSHGTSGCDADECLIMIPNSRLSEWILLWQGGLSDYFFSPELVGHSILQLRCAPRCHIWQGVRFWLLSDAVHSSP